MDATTKPSSSRRHSHREQRKYREATEGDPRLPTSESVLRQDRPDVSQLRQVRADFYSKPPEQRRKHVQEAMARDEPPRRSSTSKVKSEQPPEVVVRRVHRHSLDHQPRRRKPREGGNGGGGEQVYVYRSQPISPSDADRHPPLRRSKTTIPSSRSHGERKQRDERGIHRSSTDWGIPHPRREETMVKRTSHTKHLDSRNHAEERYRHPPVTR